MTPKVDTPDFGLLSKVVEVLASDHSLKRDTWLGKRTSLRTSVQLPVRLRVIDHDDKPSGEPALIACARDLGDSGLGIVVSEPLPIFQFMQVEIFTDVGTYVGRMQTRHCTQTIGGYKVGLACMDGHDAENDAAEEPAPEPQDRQVEVFTLEDARKEIKKAFRRYRLARESWGLLGRSMEKELAHLLRTMPVPREAELRVDPRRRDYRRDVQGEVRLLMPSSDGPKLIDTSILDLSSGGARLMATRDRESERSFELKWGVSWRLDLPLVLGIRTEHAGTLWLPARVAHHRRESIASPTYIGVEFMPEGMPLIG